LPPTERLPYREPRLVLQHFPDTQPTTISLLCPLTEREFLGGGTRGSYRTRVSRESDSRKLRSSSTRCPWLNQTLPQRGSDTATSTSRRTKARTSVRVPDNRARVPFLHPAHFGRARGLFHADPSFRRIAFDSFVASLWSCQDNKDAGLLALALGWSIYVSRRSHQLAPFVRQTGERKAQTCANAIYRQVG
jgi:hypothetical protein